MGNGLFLGTGQSVIPVPLTSTNVTSINMKHQLRSSPQYVVRKTSFTDYNIDFLGFNFEVFIQEGGELNGFLAATASKVLTSWTSYGATDALNGDLIIKVMLAPHESATDYFADAKSEFNRGTSGSGVDPVRALGKTMVHWAGLKVISCQIIN